MRLTRFAMALLVALILLPTLAGAEMTLLYINDGEARPLYREMKEEGEALRVLASGEAFSLLESAGDWARILVYTEDGGRLEGYSPAEGFREKTPADGISLALVSPAQGADHTALLSQARSGADSLGKYFRGVTARVLEKREDGWFKLGIGSLEGYMRSDDLLLDPAMEMVQPMLPETTVQYEDGTGLTMRAAQSFQSEKMGAYSNGTRVKVLGFTDDFAHVVSPDGKVGFMMAWGVSPQASSLVIGGGADVLSTPPPGAYVITISNTDGEGAHLRTKASTDSDSLGLYTNGTQVYVIGYGEFWTRVWAEGKTGYMMTKLLGVQQ